jgi:hypothetical protein
MSAHRRELLSSPSPLLSPLLSPNLFVFTAQTAGVVRGGEREGSVPWLSVRKQCTKKREGEKEINIGERSG